MPQEKVYKMYQEITIFRGLKHENKTKSESQDKTHTMAII